MSYFLDNREFMRPKSNKYREEYNRIFRKGKKDDKEESKEETSAEEKRDCSATNESEYTGSGDQQT